MIEILHTIAYMLLGAYLLGFVGTAYLAYKQDAPWAGGLILALCWPILVAAALHEALS